MRYYFMNQEMKDFALDVEVGPNRVMEFTHEGKKTKLYIKTLAGKDYCSFDQKSWKLLFINAGYWIVTLTIMGAIICGWK